MDDGERRGEREFRVAPEVLSERGARGGAPGGPAPGALSPAGTDTRGSDETARSLRCSIKDGAAHAVMLGAGENNLAAFAVLLGASDPFLGLFSSLPLLGGSLAQVASVGFLNRARRRKPLVVVPAVVQALCWAPILALALAGPGGLGASGPLLLMAVALLYHGLGHFSYPVWNSWMGDLLDPATRGDFFGRRDRLRAVLQMGAMIAAGLLLREAKDGGLAYRGFALVFLVALLARFLSARAIAATGEPSYVPPTEEERFSFLEFLRRMPHGNFGRFAFFMALFLGTTQVAGPFFTPFMLEDLKFDYLQYAAVSAAFAIAQTLTLRAWGRIGDRFGNRRVLSLAVLILPFLPMQWLVSTSFPAILAFQIGGGIAWAGFSLGAVNFLFDSVAPAKRARCVAYYSVVVNAGILLGAIFAGWLSKQLPGWIDLADLPIPLVSHRQLLFLLSGLLRLVIVLAFLRTFREVRKVEAGSTRAVLAQFVGLLPVLGYRISVFTGVHRDEREGPPPPAPPGA